MKNSPRPFLCRRPLNGPRGSPGGGIDLQGRPVVFLRPMDKLDLDGVEIAVIKKDIKNMYLRVLPPDGRAVLSAPRRMPDHVIVRFARERLEWVKRHQQEYAARQEPSYSTGDTLYLWGRPFRLAVRSAGSKPRVETGSETIYLFAPADSGQQARRALLDKWYSDALSQAVVKLLPELEARVGKRAARIRIRDMKSRWGTCNVRSAAITLNLQLAKRAPQYLEYVLLHELTHLWEPGHNARFYQLMDEFCPNWRQLRKELKRSL